MAAGGDGLHRSLGIGVGLGAGHGDAARSVLPATDVASGQRGRIAAPKPRVGEDRL